MYKLAIFDMDGTLLDTIDDLAAAGNYALRAAGLPEHPREAYKYFVGNGIHNLILRACAPVTDTASIDQVKAVFRTYYNAHAQDRTRPYDGMQGALAALKQAGIKLAVLSNKPHAYVRVLAEEYFPGLFDAAYGQRDGVPIKPDPTVAKEILQLFGCTAAQCAYIGDTAVDMETGNSAGLFTVGVLWGFRPRDELEGSGAKVIIDKCSDLPKVLIDN